MRLDIFRFFFWFLQSNKRSIFTICNKFFLLFLKFCFYMFKFLIFLNNLSFLSKIRRNFSSQPVKNNSTRNYYKRNTKSHSKIDQNFSSHTNSHNKLKAIIFLFFFFFLFFKKSKRKSENSSFFCFDHNLFCNDII